MKKNNKDLQYRLEKERNLWMIYWGLALSILCISIDIYIYLEEKEFADGSHIYAVPSLALVLYLLYANYSIIKRKILSCYGERLDAEIVRARYGSPGRWGTPSYYLEIDFINSKGKRKTIYTSGYHGNPNNYLKSAKCSVYEWKGFYVEADLQVRDEVDPFGYAGIPTEKKHFIWR